MRHMPGICNATFGSSFLRAKLKLQIAFDHVSSAEAAALAQSMGTAADLVEAGTPMLAREGAGALRALRAALPHAMLVADYKIVDGGRQIAALAFEAGANWVTVLGCAEDVVIREVLDVARACNGSVCVDLIGVGDPLARAREVHALGVTAVAVHASAASSQGQPRTIDFALMRALRTAAIPFVAAGGVNFGNIRQVTALQPAIVIAGSAVLDALDPSKAACELKKSMG
jgi:3-hexulose-6-phosphate synthase